MEQKEPTKSRPLIKERYEIEQVLASGSDCSTFLAQDLQHNSPCVIKQLQMQSVSNWKRLELFKREARTLAHLKHPQIPRLLDYFEQTAQRRFYLVLQKVPGVTLAERVYSGLHLSEDVCYLIAVQILKILSYLHHFNPPVIHRDIKPSNLLLDESGAIYLIDFGGVQELLGQGAGGSTMIGTYGYMAPEQFSGRALPQSDLYGLGATLVFLLSGREPANLPQQDLMLNFRPYVECSARFATWIEQLLLPAPEQRFSGAEEALEVLEDILPHYGELSLPALQEEVSRAIEIDLKPLQRPQQEDEHSEVSDAILHPGQALSNHYTVEEVLGQGDIAVTYGAVDTRNGKRVIVRELHFDRLTHWKSYELFEREIKTLERLKHKCLPAFIEHFEVKSDERHRFYIVSERIVAETLEDKLRKGWRPGESVVRDLAVQLLQILVFLQAQDPPLIHRDIKPSNLLLDDEQLLYLIDFGAVQEAFRLQGGGGSTVIGTYGYMAPEQFVGKAVPQSDLYAVGATLVHLLSGVSPAEMPQQELSLQFGDFVHCSRPLCIWLDKILAPSLDKRYADPHQALHDLERLDRMPMVSSQMQSQDLEVLDPEDLSIQIEEGVEGLKLSLRPMFYDYQKFMWALSGVNLLGVPFFLMMPEVGFALAMALPIGSWAGVQLMKNKGREYLTQIQIDPDEFSYVTSHCPLRGPSQVLEQHRFPTDSIQTLSLVHYDIENRLAIRVQYGATGRMDIRNCRYPLSHHRRRAEYLVERMLDTLAHYRRQREKFGRRPPYAQ